MDKENETDSDVDDVTTESTEDEVNWEARARQLEEKAKLSREKNKEFRNKTETELNDLKSKLKSLEETQTKNSQLTAPDYGKLAFLEAKGLNHPDDVKVVEDEANRLKLALTDVLGMQHIQTRLQANREERIAKEGLPTGTTGTGASSKGTVEYWLQKGGIPMTPDGNIDQELAEKVIEARVKKETNANQFAPIH